MKLSKKMMSAAACSALLLIGGIWPARADDSNGQGQNQQGDNPFHGKTDSGDDAHILPTPDVLLGKSGAKPTFAPKNIGGKATVYPPSYGSGNLTNHGGPEMPGASYFAVYWNSNVANPVSAQIQAFVQAFGGSASNYPANSSPDYTIIQQYGARNPISYALPWAGMWTDSKANQSSISDSSIRNWLKGLFSGGHVPLNANYLYGLYFPSGMKVTMNFFQASCTSFCGYHSSFNYNGQTIKYAVFPYPDCSGCSISGRSPGDMLTIVSSHEIREAVSDPLGNAWYDSQGYEADDKCVWHNLYQTANGGFWVQPEYSNGGMVTASGFTATYPGPGCIVP
jgi:hypothetical protein